MERLFTTSTSARNEPKVRVFAETAVVQGEGRVEHLAAELEGGIRDAKLLLQRACHNLDSEGRGQLQEDVGSVVPDKEREDRLCLGASRRTHIDRQGELGVTN